ncbi:hypothetical protein BC831DRAFT_511220 [Entophlyctis helioformis]|nr:hypothetical protein BC831DRAFT_511220 [Entophlyctis helioformis]
MTTEQSNNADADADADVRRETGIKRIGTYLLSGWVLLDTMCPRRGCGMPMLCTKDRKRTVCCLCDDADLPLPPVGRAPAVDADAVASVAAVDAHHGLQQLQDLDDLDRELDALNAEMANDDNNDDHNNDDGQDGHGFHGVSAETARINQERRELSDRASRLIGQRMLQGWAILQDECAACPSIPLVRSRQKQTLCVICGRVDGKLPASAAPVAAVPAVSAPVAAPSASAAVAASHGQKRPFELLDDRVASLEQQHSQQSQHNQQQALHNQQQSHAVAVLRAKMAQLTADLDAAHYPQAIQAISDAMASCARALSALSSLSSL